MKAACKRLFVKVEGGKAMPAGFALAVGETLEGLAWATGEPMDDGADGVRELADVAREAGGRVREFDARVRVAVDDDGEVWIAVVPSEVHAGAEAAVSAALGKLDKAGDLDAFNAVYASLFLTKAEVSR